MDAVVVGRNTYETARTRLKKRNTYVLTRSITRTYRKGSVTFINPDTVDIIKILGHHRSVAVLGGSAVYGYFFDREYIDDLYLTIEPLVFGYGVPMTIITSTLSIRMLLVSVKRLNKTGTLLIHYRSTL